MADRVVGDSDRTVARWIDNGELVTDGDAFARYSRVNGGVVEYMQADFSFDPALYEFPLSLAADGFDRFFVWPSSAAGWTITETARHSVHGFSEDSVEHNVKMPEDVGFTASDRETLAAIFAKPSGGGGIVYAGGGGGIGTDDREKIAGAVADAVWADPHRSLTAPVEIAGGKARLDDLNDLSASQLRELIRAVMLPAISSLEGSVESGFLLSDTREGADARAAKLVAAVFSRFDSAGERLEDRFDSLSLAVADVSQHISHEVAVAALAMRTIVSDHVDAVALLCRDGFASGAAFHEGHSRAVKALAEQPADNAEVLVKLEAIETLKRETFVRLKNVTVELTSHIEDVGAAVRSSRTIAESSDARIKAVLEGLALFAQRAV